jgi:hypothetical protein
MIMNKFLVPFMLAVVPMVGADEQQIVVSTIDSGRLYADYTFGDCCTLDAWDSEPNTIWTDNCGTMGGYCSDGRDVANWMFQIPQRPEGAELAEVRLKVYRQTGSAGNASLRLRGSDSSGLGIYSAQQAYFYPDQSQDVYFSSGVLQTIVLPLSYFVEPDLDPYLIVALYRSSVLSFNNSGNYAPKLEFIFDVETGPPCDGDINEDGVVDGSDLSQVLGYWGSSSALHDLDGNGVVNGADLTIVLGNWGDCPEGD